MNTSLPEKNPILGILVKETIVQIFFLLEDLVLGVWKFVEAEMVVKVALRVLQPIDNKIPMLIFLGRNHMCEGGGSGPQLPIQLGKAKWSYQNQMIIIC